MKNTLVEKSWKKWGALFAVSLAFGAVFAARFMWSTIMPAALDGWKLTSTQGGAFMTAYFIGYIITQIPGGNLTDKYGGRAVLSISLFICTAVTALNSFFGYEFGLVLRVLQGLSAGTVYASGLKVIGVYFDIKLRATATSIFFLATNLGLTFNNKFGPMFVESIGWKNTFIVSSVLILAAALSCTFLIGDTRKMVDDESKSDKITLKEGLKNFFKNKDLVLLGLASFFYYWTNTGLKTWIMVFLVKGINVDSITAGAFLALLTLIFTPGGFISGVLMDKLRVSKRLVLIWTMFFMAVSVAAMGYTSSYKIIMALLIIREIAGAPYGTAIATLITERSGLQFAGSAHGTQNMFNQAASIVAPIGLGFILDITNSNWTICWMVIGVTGLIATAFFIALTKDKALLKKKEIGGN